MNYRLEYVVTTPATESDDARRKGGIAYVAAKDFIEADTKLRKHIELTDGQELEVMGFGKADGEIIN